MPSFNLVSDPWIPVRDHGGRLREVGLREALEEAPNLRRIEDPSPLVEAALHRLLLAVLHRGLEGPKDAEDVLELWEGGSLATAQVRDYLDRFADRFDLFDAGRPFYQVPDLPEEAPLPWTKLAAERASGNNPTLFDHTTDAAPRPGSPAEVTRALIAHQSFTPGGLIRRLGVSAGKSGPVAAAAVLLPLGDTLFETLLLNLLPYDPSGDLAIWERPPYRTEELAGGAARESLSGRTRVYTWLSRSVRLLPESDGAVRWVAYGPGVFPEEGRVEADPMCAYQVPRGGVPQAVRFAAERAFWRDFESFVPDERQATMSPRVLEHARAVLRRLGRGTLLFPVAVLGQVTDQAKILALRREVYPLPLNILDPEAAYAVRIAVAKAGEVGKRLRAAGFAMAKALMTAGEREPKGEEVGRLVDSLPLAAVYWSTLDEAFPGFLRELGERGSETAHRYWLEQLKEAVRRGWDQAARAVGLGARQIKAVDLGERRVRALLAALDREVEV